MIIQLETIQNPKISTTKPKA